MMKKILLFILILLSVSVIAADSYKIERMNGDSIIYRGQSLKIGDVFLFDCKGCIIWGNVTKMYARNMRTRFIEPIDKEELVANNHGSFLSFFIKRNLGSYRTFGDYSMSLVLDGYILLEDTIRVLTDDPDIIDFYAGKLSESEMPQYVMSYQYNGEIYTVYPKMKGDELEITRQLFSDIPAHSLIKATVYSIDRSGRKRLITNSMFIEML